MYFFGLGCCIFDGSSYKEKGTMAQEECLSNCMQDSRCVACELKQCVVCATKTDFYCRIYYTTKVNFNLKDFKTGCEKIGTKKCYKKIGVFQFTP